jgi:hypothetical protein
MALNKKTVMHILAAVAALALVLRFRNQIAGLGSKVPGFKQLAGL